LLRSNYSITKLVDGLEKEGLVVRRRDGKDRRVYQVCVTPLGCSFIGKSFALMTKGEERINTCLTKEESQTLIELSRRVRINLIEHITGLSEDKIIPIEP
jgi:DNA-binding MarR family transcriptional regulator